MAKPHVIVDEDLPVIEIPFKSGTIVLDSNKVTIHNRKELNKILGGIRLKTSMYQAMVEFHMEVGESLSSWEKRAEEKGIEMTDWVSRRENESPLEHATRLNLPRSDDAEFVFDMLNQFHKYLRSHGPGEITPEDAVYQISEEDFEVWKLPHLCARIHRFTHANRLWVPEVAPVNSKS